MNKQIVCERICGKLYKAQWKRFPEEKKKIYQRSRYRDSCRIYSDDGSLMSDGSYDQ